MLPAQVVAVETEFDTSGTSRLQGLAALIAVRSSLFFPARIGRDLRPHRPQRSRHWISTGWRGRSARCHVATVRIIGDRPQRLCREAVGRMDFGMGADDADGADGCAPAFLAWRKCGIVVMVMVRVRARPSRPKPISMPILRRNVAARRSRPASARGLSGQVLDLATRSPATSARAPRRSEAVPVHTVCVAITARTAVAIGSASITPSTASSRLPQ